MTDRDNQPSSDLVEQAIERAVGEAHRDADTDSLDVARYPYFAPRSLGATAPHDCMTWSVDQRDVRGGEPTGGTRQLGDRTIDKQLGGLLAAGLRVRPKRR